MKLTYDPQADAAYVYVVESIPDGGVDGTHSLDMDRNVDYDTQDRLIGYEFLNVRRLGVRLDDLEHRDELARLFREAGIEERHWSEPWPEQVLRKHAAS